VPARLFNLMGDHRGGRAHTLPRMSRREELAALRHDLAFVIGVIGDVLRGRPFAS
jgi:hypothetical protein